MPITRDCVGTFTDLAHINPTGECNVLSLSGGHTFRSKMYQLGIHEGTRVRVIQNGRSGPMVIELGESRLIIGRHMARKIMVNNA